MSREIKFKVWDTQYQKWGDLDNLTYIGLDGTIKYIEEESNKIKRNL